MARHEARHSPHLRLAPACSQPRPRLGVAELGAVGRRQPHGKRTMKPSDSQSRFEQFVADSGSSVATLAAPDAIRLMLAFYRQVRAANCLLDQDGDMLLFQWGPHDFGEGEAYRYNITRQFIAPGDEDDDGMSQLSLTVRYPVTSALRTLNGSQSCPSPAQAGELEQFIRSHEATKAVASLAPLQTTLAWSPT